MDFNKLPKGGISLFETIINHPNLLGLWILNEQDGDTVYDFTDNRNDGTIVGSPIKSKSIKSSFGYNFDGVTSWINFGNLAVFDFERTNPFSGICLIDPVSALSQRAIITKRLAAGDQTGWGWHVASNRTSQIILRNSSVNRITVRSNDVLTQNIDYMLGFSYDGSSLGAGVKLYHNGIANTPFNVVDDTLTLPIISSASLTIAAQDNSSSNVSDDDLSFIALFNDDLPATDFKRFAYAASYL